MKQFNRKQYLNGECTHNEYYSQYVDEDILATVKNNIGVERLKKSTDEHLNDISSRTWDSLSGCSFRGGSEMITPPRPSKKLYDQAHANGDGISACFMTCVYKAAARQLIAKA